ncbi:JAB domain-containing protein [Sphingobium sp. CCH11-B1]|uniref:JAB domain-containing protein n=1 Tax=Sphingobium sp. CCH11-B1 TaxID=1768781 RepID=UPI00082A3726|nr:JAB domain-containing protein [Sphingobium sp. CCH11-B1]
MSASSLLSIATLDAEWRVRTLLPLAMGWSEILGRLVRDEGGWVALIQRRPDPGTPVPLPDDILFTRALLRSLRPLDIGLADHIIATGQERFSFRDAGLL